MKRFTQFRAFGARLGGGLVALSLVPAVAFAQAAPPTIDPTPVIALVDEATAFITTVGLAVLLMLMIAKGIKWARKAG